LQPGKRKGNGKQNGSNVLASVSQVVMLENLTHALFAPYTLILNRLCVFTH
jgi:hypothetical protein